MGYIYKIVNKINGKFYIGQTVKTIEERWEQHKKKAKQHPNRYLYDAMNYYGYDNFSIEIIEECPNENLNTREKYWIKQLHSFYLDKQSIGYNMTFGGDGGNTWILNPHKEETSKKISSALKGHLVSKETREKLSQSKKGKHQVTIDKQELLIKIKNGQSISDLCNYYGTCEWTIRHRCKEWFGVSYGQLREQPVKRKTYTWSEEGKKSHIDANKQRIGSKNSSYKALPIQEFYDDIVSGMTADNICKKYSISKPTIYKKCKEYFNKTLKEIRKDNKNA